MVCQKRYICTIGNGEELYVDRDKKDWPRKKSADGQPGEIEMKTEALDVEDLMKELSS